MSQFSAASSLLSEAELKAIHRRSLERQLLAAQTEMIRVSREIVRLQGLLNTAA